MLTTPFPRSDPRTAVEARGRTIIDIAGLTKSYRSGLTALAGIDLQIAEGEIFALLGPNGAGKTTLISIVCGIARATAGRVTVDGHDVVHDYRSARSKIGLVPQELTVDAFAKVSDTVAYSRGLFRRGRDPAFVDRILRDLSLYDKRDSMLMTLSGGMKRRVMIAKALAHEPRVLFLDEPTAGVDVELRRDMWAMIRRLRDGGVTVILTTHYIEEAEEMADRVGVIRRGEIVLVEEKAALMRKLGRKELTVQLRRALDALPTELAPFDLARSADGASLTYTFDAQAAETGIAALMRQLAACGVDVVDLQTRQSSLEDIFVSLVSDSR